MELMEMEKKKRWNKKSSCRWRPWRWWSWTWRIWIWRNIRTLNYWNNRVRFRMYIKYGFLLASMGSFSSSQLASKSVFWKNYRNRNLHWKFPSYFLRMVCFYEHHNSSTYVNGLNGMLLTRFTSIMGWVLKQVLQSWWLFVCTI